MKFLDVVNDILKQKKEE